MGTATGSGTDQRWQPTLATVASAAGVSPATVSRVVNGVATVLPAHRQAVEEAIERLGYVPNRAARSLVTRRTGSLALVVREPVEFGVMDPYVSGMIISASEALADSGGHLVVMMAKADTAHASAGEYVRAGHIDGALLVSMHKDDPLPKQLLSARIPVAIAGRPPADLQGIAYVDADNLEGGRIAAERLLSLGRKRIAMVSGPLDMVAAEDRLAGFRGRLEEAGREVPWAAGAFTQASGQQAMEELLAEHPDIDGVFAASDVMALGAMRALRTAGRTVPDDVAIIGFDDVDVAQYADPPLTTIRQPVREQAHAMVAAVLHQIRGDGVPESLTLPTSLVVRSSG